VLTLLNEDSAPASAYSATKTVSGSFVAGGTVTYTVVLSNNTGFTLADNPGDEFTDVLPAGLSLVSANATSGTAVATIGTNTVTWNGSIASGATVTISITATITVSGGTISNQGTAHVDLDNNGTNETNVVTDDPSVAGTTNATSFTISSASQITATKTASGGTTGGSIVTYTITITNNMPHAQADNPGDEFTDVLPVQLALINATATSGTITTDLAARTVHWNGSLASGASVTITITASINTSTGGSIANQGSAFVDLDNNGSNETTVLTDDPATAAPFDATALNALGAAGAPTLSTWMLMLLGAMLAYVALRRI
jgi:uncharacterized repeat protein (TIGR01451 family)